MSLPIYASESDLSEEESGFLLYRFSSDKRFTKGLESETPVDFLDVLVAMSNLELPSLPIVWQKVRASIGLGASSSVRQAPIDLQTNLAFKLVKDIRKASGSHHEILALVRNEIVMLCHPHLRAHRNIVDLLGVCWDIPGNDIVWPTLVMEKSHFGDLTHFVKLPIWQELAVADRIGICVDIGNALAEMHVCNIIHGDIKPHNVLVFKDRDGLAAKLADFGYSREYKNDTDNYPLPCSEPWQAPEVDGSDRTFSLVQAKAADIYSYTLLCAWILSWDQISDHEVDAGYRKDMKSPETLVSESNTTLERLKQNKKLKQVISNYLKNNLGPGEEEESKALRELFEAILGDELHALQDIWEHFKLLEKSDTKFDQPNHDALSGEFKINKSIQQYYEGDHRVRRYIAKCLKARIHNTTSPQTTNNIAQLAVCYQIGFGIPKNDDKYAELVSDGNVKSLAETEIISIDTRTPTSEHPITSRIFMGGYPWHLHSDQQNRDFNLIKETQHVLKRELGDLINSINDQGLRWALCVNLIVWFRMEGNFREAEKIESGMLEARLEAFGNGDIMVIASQINLGYWYWQQGKSDLALDLTRKAHEVCMKNKGEDDILTLTIMGNIASFHYSLGEYRKAELLEFYLETKRTTLLGKDHPDILTSMANRAAILWRQGRLNEAEALAKAAYLARLRIYGTEQADTMTSMSNLALIYQSQGRYDEAKDLQIKTLAIGKRILGELSPATLMNMSNLALSYWHLQELDEAEDLNLHTIARRKLILGADHPDLLTSMANLALVYESQGRFDEAIDLETEVLEKSRSSSALGRTHPDTLSSIDNLANTHHTTGRYEQAARLWSEALGIRKEILDKKDPDTKENARKLIIVYKKLGRTEEAQEIQHWWESLEL